MKLYELVFSPTGGTQKVGDRLKADFPGSWERVALLKADADLNCMAEDICLVTVPGERPYRKYSGAPMKPAAGGAGCGTCAWACPVGTIPAKRPESVDVERCSSCMRCIAV